MSYLSELKPSTGQSGLDESRFHNGAYRRARATALARSSGLKIHRRCPRMCSLVVEREPRPVVNPPDGVFPLILVRQQEGGHAPDDACRKLAGRVHVGAYERVTEGPKADSAASNQGIDRGVSSPSNTADLRLHGSGGAKRPFSAS